MKIDSAIKKAYLDLKNKKIKSALLDSEILMSKVLNEDRINVLLNSERLISNQNYKNFRKLIFNRLQYMPIAYLTGKKSFWKYEFEINNKVLIPRPDTELIIEQVLKIYKNKNKIKFLDIGFGSGCILLSILKEREDFKATGVDISNKALKECKINVQKLGLQNRVKLYNSDIDKFSLGKYDLIISNPPYIKNFDLKYLENEVRMFEPRLALNGGLDGISEIRKVVKKSSELIKKGGKLILEIAYNQNKEVKKLLKENGFYINSVVKDYANNDRCIISTK